MVIIFKYKLDTDKLKFEHAAEARISFINLTIYEYNLILKIL